MNLGAHSRGLRVTAVKSQVSLGFRLLYVKGNMQQSIKEEEAVYSSDGLSPLSLPIVPIALVQASQHSNGDIQDEYDTNPVLNSRAAFEMFQGKLYAPPDDSDIIRSKRHQSLDRESFLEKLARLNEEIKGLETDLPMIGLSSNATQNKNAEATTVEHIRNEIQDLSSRLNSLSSAVGTLGRSKLKHQSDLTSLIKQDVTKLSSSLKSSSIQTNRSISATSTLKKVGPATVSSPKSEHSHNTISSPDRGTETIQQSSLQSNSIDMNDSNTLEILETRLRRMENFVGHSSTSAFMKPIGTHETLLQRLFELEQKIHRMDDKALEVAATRAKVIRADLEAAAKAKNKLNSGQSNTSEDAIVISRLYEQMLDLEGFFVTSPSNLLTSIVQRLSTCANLHSKAMTFESRLIDLERIVKEMNPLVRNIEDSVEKVASGMIVNMKVLEENMNTLDDRIKSLRK